eukprot:6512561-Ditylum_brightwellii.AAC.1
MEELKRERQARSKEWEKYISNHISPYKQKVDILEKEWENIKRESQELEKEKAELVKKYGDANADEDDQIQINVGGKVITAS